MHLVIVLFPECNVLADNPLEVSAPNLVQLKGNFGTQLHVTYKATNSEILY